jgi:hypothetical protein
MATLSFSFAQGFDAGDAKSGQRLLEKIAILVID